MKKIATYNEKNSNEIITVYENIESETVLFMVGNDVKHTINSHEYIEYETLSELENTIDKNDPKLEIEESMKAAMLVFIEDEELENEFPVIYNILKNIK